VLRKQWGWEVRGATFLLPIGMKHRRSTQSVKKTEHNGSRSITERIWARITRCSVLFKNILKDSIEIHKNFIYPNNKKFKNNFKNIQYY
jgi:hypothetical protein